MPDIYIESQRLIDELKATFASVSRGTGVTLHEAEVIDDYGSDAEREAARKLDTDNSWTELSHELIAAHPSVLSFLDVQGLRYYLPAYLTFALQDLVEWDGPTPNVSSALVISHLVVSEEFREHQLERFRSFSAAESEVICSVLRFVAANFSWLSNDAQEALSAYWGKFCTGE